MEDDNEPITIPLDPKCTRRGCKGSVDFPDMSEVYGGQRGRCDTCGRAHVAIEYPNSMRVQQVRERNRDNKGPPMTPHPERPPMENEKLITVREPKIPAATEYEEVSYTMAELRETWPVGDESVVSKLIDLVESQAAALAAATAREALGKKDTQTAFAWVVEHAESEQSRPRYYDGIGWSDPGDNEAAIRFAREKDARFFANKLDWPNVHRVCEHGWDEQIAAALSPAKSTEAK